MSPRKEINLSELRQAVSESLQEKDVETETEVKGKEGVVEPGETVKF